VASLLRGRELIPVARRLCQGRPATEARARSAVSRAYYAAFSELLEYLSARSLPPPRGRSPHDAAWHHLRSGIVDGDPDRAARRRAVADTGFLLKERRQKADYRLASRLARGEASGTVDAAERIIQELDRLAAAPRKS
jgi:hypothetical protein